MAENSIVFDQTGGFEQWANELCKHITDEGDETSFAAVVKKWSEYCKDAAEARIFTGQAAEKNFTKFKEVNDAFQKFFNDLGKETGEAAKNVQKAFNELESNVAIGGGVDIGQLALEVVDVPPVPNYETTQEIIEYNPTALRTLSTNIANLNEDLRATKTYLEGHLDKLNGADKIWNGDFAERYKTAVKDVLNNNIPKIEDDVTGVSNYIANGIAQAAEDLDSTEVTAG